MSNKGLTTCWQSMCKLLNLMKIGDLIEVDGLMMFGAKHIAIYVGVINSKHQLVHIWGSCGKRGDASVQMDVCEEVFVGKQVRINNSIDAEYPPDEPNKIASRALGKVGTAVKYDLVTSNCEHFANYCRHGHLLSQQVRDRFANTVFGGIVGMNIGNHFGPWGAAIGASSGSTLGAMSP